MGQGQGHYADFVNSEWPWFKRGGNWNNGTGAGAFNFNNDNGNANDNNSWRSVLVVGDYNNIKFDSNFHSMIVFTDIMVMYIVESLFLFSSILNKHINSNFV